MPRRRLVALSVRYARSIRCVGQGGAGRAPREAVGVATARGFAAAASATPTSSLSRLTLAMDGSTMTVGGALQAGGANVVSMVTTGPQGHQSCLDSHPDVTVAQVHAYRAVHPNADP
jgi:hypothetical protein